MTLLELALVGVGVVLAPLLIWLYMWSQEGRVRGPTRTGWHGPRMGNDDRED